MSSSSKLFDGPPMAAASAVAAAAGGAASSSTTRRRKRSTTAMEASAVSTEAEEKETSAAGAPIVIDASSSSSISPCSSSDTNNSHSSGDSNRNCCNGQGGPQRPDGAVDSKAMALSPSSAGSGGALLENLSTAMSMTTHRYDYRTYDPVRGMVYSWICCIMLPVAAVAWRHTRGSLAWTALATLATPLLAIAQGTVGILHFRLWFGDAPLPQTPTHGVVMVRSDGDDKNCRRKGRPRDSSTADGTMGEETDLLEEAARQPPVRLLVIGDSLAIGVGQSGRSTPIMPEVIAKTISRRLGGRVVYWTCHGAPGASTGWIVRELERGVPVEDDVDEEDEEEEETVHEEDDHELIVSLHTRSRGRQRDQPGVGLLQTQSSSSVVSGGATSSETDESSSSDESASDQEQHCPLEYSDGKPANGVAVHLSSARQHLKLWKERLANHRKRFNPDVLGPYDVVVVLTGSNDLKSAFFPFLLTGEDAEFRRQARRRGGNYNNELRRLVETVYRKMRLRWQSWRVTVMDRVEAATESMREKVLTMEARMGIHGSHHKNTKDRNSPSKGNKRHASSSPSFSASSNLSESASKRIQDEHPPAELEGESPGHFPLVVLPGMPARALPIFRTVPLRWLAVPIVDIMDMHKRNLAQCHPGEVLFIDAPSVDELTLYENKGGHIWSDRCNEDTVLALRDIRKRDRLRIERHMQEYYNGKKALLPAGTAAAATATAVKSVLSRHPFRAKCPDDLFSTDRVHPNDSGYDFWGRFVGNAIVEELAGKDSRQGRPAT